MVFISSLPQGLPYLCPVKGEYGWCSLLTRSRAPRRLIVREAVSAPGATPLASRVKGLLPMYGSPATHSPRTSNQPWVFEKPRASIRSSSKWSASSNVPFATAGEGPLPLHAPSPIPVPAQPVDVLPAIHAVYPLIVEIDAEELSSAEYATFWPDCSGIRRSALSCS